MKRSTFRCIIRLWIFCIVFWLSGVCVHAEAAPKLSATSVTITRGHDKTLKISHVSGKKVTWKTSDKRIVSLKKKSNSKVILQAGKKNGTATVTAKVGKNSYKCKVTVKERYSDTTDGSDSEDVSTVVPSNQAVSAPKLLIGTWIFQNGGSRQYVYTYLEAGKTGTLELKNGATGIYHDFYFYFGGKYIAQDLSISSSNPDVLSFADRENIYYGFCSVKDGTTILKIRCQNYTYSVKITISDTNSGRYEQMRNAIYKSLNISTSTPKQYACFLLAAWICDHTVYAHNRVKTSIGLNGTYKDYFNYGEVVCAGYADLYMYLCDGIGISCRQVTSTAMNHRWNQVQIDGIWYNVDVCWMDSATDGKYSFQYFLVSDSCMSKYSTHLASEHFKATDTRFDGCCEEQRALQNGYLRHEYEAIYAGYSGFSPWMTGNWKNY